MKLESKLRAILVDLQTLGEHPCNVRRVLLSEVKTGKVVWEIKAAESSPEVWKLELVAGENAADIKNQVVGGSFDVETPTAGNVFVLDLNTVYLLKVWSENSSRPASATFSLKSL